MNRAPFLIAAASVLVAAPRLGLAYLEADGLELALPVRIVMLYVSSLGTAGVLSLGQLLIAHELALGKGDRLLWGSWLAMLTFTVALASPSIVLHLSGSALAAVLPEAPIQWLAAVLMVLAPELGAAACVRVAALRAAREREELSTEQQLEEQAVRLAQLEKELERARAAEARRSPKKASPAKESLRSCPNGCGFQGNCWAVNGHQPHCPRRRA